MSRLSKGRKVAEARPFAEMRQVHPHAAGVDIGAHEIMVCLVNAASIQLVRAFGSYTVDLQAIGCWLAEHGVETVAMESTGCIGFPCLKN